MSLPAEIRTKMEAAILPEWQTAAEHRIARSPEGHIEVMVDLAADAVEVKEIVTAAMFDGAYCCQVGCGGGGCETCPCCCAGYCVSGLDGVPTAGTSLNPDDDPEHSAEVFRYWLEVAVKHNPVAESLLGALHEVNNQIKRANKARASGIKEVWDLVDAMAQSIDHDVHPSFLHALSAKCDALLEQAPV